MTGQQCEMANTTWRTHRNERITQIKTKHAKSDESRWRKWLSHTGDFGKGKRGETREEGIRALEVERLEFGQRTTGRTGFRVILRRGTHGNDT
jgi:hypothetical protein